MLASPVPLSSNVDLQGRKQSIQGFLFLRAFSTLPSWGQRGARQKPTEFAKEKRERKAPQPKARTESEEEAGRERCSQGTRSSRDYSPKEHRCGWRKTTILSPQSGNSPNTLEHPGITTMAAKCHVISKQRPSRK